MRRFLLCGWIGLATAFAVSAPPHAHAAPQDAQRKLEVRVVEPSPNAIVGGKSLTVRLATTADAKSVKVNDQSAIPVGSGARLFQAVLRDLKAGPQTLTIVATNAQGAKATQTFKITVDQTPPRLILESPAAGLVTREETVEVVGAVEEMGAVRVTVNDVPVKVSNSSFSTTVKVAEGRPTTIVVMARDAAGNLDKVVRRVRRDAKPPALALVAPAENAAVGGTTIEVRGTVDDPSVTVTVNGVRALVEPNSRFRCRLPLSEGDHEVTVEAVDRAGNKSTAKRRFSVDRTPPVVTVTAPSGDLITPDDSVTIAGRVDDPQVTVVLIGGVETDVRAGTFNATVTLREGINDLTVEARDGAGNRSRSPIKVVRDSKGPRLRVLRPLDGSVVTESTLEVQGLCGEQVKSMTLNGEPMAVTADGRFRGAVVLEMGRNELVLLAEDLAGNRTQRRMNIVRRRSRDLRSPGLLLVPDGQFPMGRNRGGSTAERPEVTVYLAAYYLAPKETTNAEYGKFLQWQSGELTEDRDPHAYCHPDEPKNKVHVPRYARNAKRNKPQHPVVGVDWFDAYAYARWSGGRLPTEAEWERAAGWDAKRSKKRPFPWGETYRPGSAVLSGGARPVGTTKGDVSAAGAFDMGGNVQEWTSDWYRGAHGVKPRPTGRDGHRFTPQFRVVRGASWRVGDRAMASTTYRHIEDPLAYREDLGFRVCRTP